MPQQTTLLSFFNRTPKSTSSPSTSGSLVNGGTSSGGVNKTNSQNGTPKTPKHCPESESTSSLNTPVSRNGTGTKRRRTSGPQSADNQASRKKLRNEESPTKEYAEGILVWAKLDGYPWWPAMLRGEIRGGPVSRKRSMEFHVQFFDNPPTRAWVRKGDLKIYVGSHDANIPPAKGDPGWITACETADEALSMKKDERIRKHWIEFPMDDLEDAGSPQSNVEEMEVEQQETPKSRGREVKKQRRIRAISTSDEGENSGDGECDNRSKKGSRKSKKDEEDDYVPSNNASIEDDEAECSESPVESEEISEAESEPDSDDQKSKRASKSTSITNKNSTPTRKSGGIDRTEIKDKLKQFASSESPSCSSKPPPKTSDGEKESTVWTHMTLTWAKEGQRKDNRGRKETDPDYDPRTLLVPSDFLKKVTPGMRQWWEIKSKNFDTILFFKVGKFYEFYHWDACIAAKELGITYMKGDYAHSGFPEIAFSRFANALVEKGYKIARIEQTETPDELAQRSKESKLQKHEKIIRREVCQIATKGVRYASFQDQIFSNPFSPESSYLYAISEKQSTSGNECPVFGVCFIDTTIGTFHVGQFLDDRHASRLRTLLSHHVPVQILHERGKLSPILQQLLHNMPSVQKDPLISDSEFWNGKKTLKYLSEQDYFRKSESGEHEWPANFETFLSKNDGLGMTPDDKWELGLKCLGGIVWYLKYCLLEHDLLSLKRFEVYTPADITDTNGNTVSSNIPQRCRGPKYMILDGITIRNLDILNGPQSLLSTLDKCGTHFGKRLLRHWLCLPLAIPEEITERQNAVEDLMHQRESRDKVIPLMKSLPDLERLLSKIHYLGSAHRSKNHPDGRASFYEEVKYSKNRISDLLTTLKGFKTCTKIIQELKNAEDDFSSRLLKQLIGNFPCLDKLLKDFDNAFDHSSAIKEGKIKPKSGALEEYDNALQAVVDIQQEADDYLKQVSRELKARVSYFGSDKKRFQIEVPENIKVSREFEMFTKRKGFIRYYNSTTKGFLSSIMKAEAEKDEILHDIARKIFEKFDNHRVVWSAAVECIAQLDVLVSLSLFSESQELMCRPVVSASSNPFLNVIEGRHPCVASDTYIPNDTDLGTDGGDDASKGSFVILTGPNMGGKSTLMRQVGLLAVLSHVGCYVPAEKCEMSVVDRVFTRLGANDNIGEGESTFFVEMSETSAILKHASADSLLLIDELGRGTATYDGTAIAYAAAKELSSRRCRSLFSTHYHTLVDALQNVPSIQMCHMACMVENENEEDPTQESITFLYKMISGPCPKSYGFNAARLAGISDDVIRVAHKKAKELESTVTGIRNFTDTCSLINQKKFSMKDFANLSL